MVVEPAKPGDGELLDEGVRVLADRERLSLIVNLPGIAFIAAIAPLMSYGGVILVAALLRLIAVGYTRWHGTRARKAIAAGEPLAPYAAGFAASLGFAGFTWGFVLWPVARFGLSEPLGALLIVYVCVGIPLIIVMAATLPRLLLAFGGCMIATLGIVLLAEPSSDGTMIVLALMGLFVAALAGGYGMHRQQTEVARTTLEKNKLAEALAEANEELADALAHAEFLSQRDPLTGLLNRRAFFEDACRHGELEAAGGHLLAIDLDHFKAINDRFGHAVGDRVLAATADCMRELVHSLPGEGHCAVRLGGEEFALVLARTGEDRAIAAAENLRSLFATIPAELDTAGLVVSASIGVAKVAPRQDIAAALHDADRALYKAKAAGRDRVMRAAA